MASFHTSVRDRTLLVFYFVAFPFANINPLRTFPANAFNAAESIATSTTLPYGIRVPVWYRLYNTFLSTHLPVIVPYGFHRIGSLLIAMHKNKRQVFWCCVRIQCTAMLFLVGPEANRFTQIVFVLFFKLPYRVILVCVHTGVQGACWAKIRTPVTTQPRQIPQLFFFISFRRNILSDINNAEFTMLPVPQEKESLQVFLRVKPKTDHELKVYR